MLAFGFSSAVDLTRRVSDFKFTEVLGTIFLADGSRNRKSSVKIQTETLRSCKGFKTFSIKYRLAF